MSFSYNSSVQFSKSVSSVAEFGLRIEEETRVAIDDNHRSVCRFTSSDIRLPVLTNLVQMVKRWILMLNRQVSEGVYFDRLGTSNHLLHKGWNPSPIQETCSWVLSHPDSDVAAIADLVNQGFPELLLHDVQERLIARADRTFIWITLILDLLRDIVECEASERELDDILESRTADQIFTEVLRGGPDVSKTREMFSILLAAARPLKVEELSIALALTPEYSALSKSRKPLRPKWQNPKRLK
ncbi:hypothetical protein F4782DRAFT_536419 [Xylaria castorea]|nr:hypothetical protein F4782DRAFT_536419 [Xylaria castorea]